MTISVSSNKKREANLKNYEFDKSSFDFKLEEYIRKRYNEVGYWRYLPEYMTTRKNQI